MLGYAKEEKSKRKRKKWIRYERKHSMELWHTDWFYFEGKWIIAYLDDASRLIVGYRVFDEATTDNALQVLREAIDNYGKLESILTDRSAVLRICRGEESKRKIQI